MILLYPTVENAEIKKDIEKIFKRLQRASVNGLYKKGEFKLLVRYLSYNLSTKKKAKKEKAPGLRPDA